MKRNARLKDRGDKILKAEIAKLKRQNDSLGKTLDEVKEHLTKAQVMELADTGMIAVDGSTWKLYNPSGDSDVIQIPQDLCHSDGGTCSYSADWTGKYQTFAPAGRL